MGPEPPQTAQTPRCCTALHHGELQETHPAPEKALHKNTAFSPLLLPKPQCPELSGKNSLKNLIICARLPYPHLQGAAAAPVPPALSSHRVHPAPRHSMPASPALSIMQWGQRQRGATGFPAAQLHASLCLSDGISTLIPKESPASAPWAGLQPRQSPLPIPCTPGCCLPASFWGIFSSPAWARGAVLPSQTLGWAQQSSTQLLWASLGSSSSAERASQRFLREKKKRQGGYMPAFSARVVAYTATLERFI